MSGKASTPPNPRRAVALKLNIIARKLSRRFDHNAQRSGLTRAKWTLIAAVARMPGATQRSIAAALEVTEVTAGRLIDRLCADGLLERRENPADRRGYSVHLAPAAKPVLDTLGRIATTHEQEAFAGMDNDELAQLESLLDRIERNLAALQCQEPAEAADEPR